MYSKAELVADLAQLKVREGTTLLVQAAGREIGEVDGGLPTVVDALTEALGALPDGEGAPGGDETRRGTLVVYTATPENSCTSPLHLARIAGLDEAGVRAFRAGMPPYDPERTPASRTLGRLPEEVRLRPGTRRSGHPQTSFTALGAQAEFITAGHELDSHLGERSPTARLYDLDAWALLIGVPVWCCTALHLAEYRIPEALRPHQEYGSVVLGEDGRAQWRHFDAVRVTDVHFEEMASALKSEVTGLRTGWLGKAPCFLLPIREAVDVCVDWLTDHRS